MTLDEALATLPQGSVVRFEFTDPYTYGVVVAEWDGEAWYCTGEEPPWYPPKDLTEAKCEVTLLYRGTQRHPVTPADDQCGSGLREQIAKDIEAHVALLTAASPQKLMTRLMLPTYLLGLEDAARIARTGSINEDA